MIEKKIITTAETINVGYAVEEAEKFLKEYDIISEEWRENILVVIDEAITNVVMYSYKNKKNKDKHGIRELKCYLFIDEKEKLLKIEIYDYGDFFIPDFKKIAKVNFVRNGTNKGGFGLYLMSYFMDEINFTRNNEKSENILIMKKYLDKI